MKSSLRKIEFDRNRLSLGVFPLAEKVDDSTSWREKYLGTLSGERSIRLSHKRIVSSRLRFAITSDRRWDEHAPRAHRCIGDARPFRSEVNFLAV